MAAAVYMLRCADGSYYVGCTRDGNTDHRLAQHNAGFGGAYTRQRRPVELVWAEAFASYDDAFAAERRIKRWSRAKKDALIRGDFEGVGRAAKKDWDAYRERRRGD
ncbi:MAG: GIY-YIG nuclease family protein [Alphaproteobacteria bacterium]|nr:GIY-YIG nuclease family protein [Alphaproteobacteria bacterium]MCB9927917.1 GIY-YIG nuclease family protein [Alphaproteobacteria bacterium]